MSETPAQEIPGPPRPAGTWGLRLLIRLGAGGLALLVYWLLGFLVADIRSVRGPEWEDFESRHVSEAVVAREKQAGEALAGLRREESDRQETQRIKADASANLQRTLQQLVELQRLSTERQVALSDQDRENLASSLAQFLKYQGEYQVIAQELVDLAARRRAAELEVTQVAAEVTELREAAQKEYRVALTAHRFRLALGQLALLLPLLGVAGWLLVRRRASPLATLHLAVAVAILLKVVGVAHEYFPRRVFNYVFIIALIGVMARLLLHWIRSAAAPKPAALHKQRREAYERFLCPGCEYPIRTGPRRFLYWTRRTVHKVLPPPGAEVRPEPYTCPACGTGLFHSCPACQKIRHALLPHCEHCGAPG
jgi:hypothetical protein